MMRCIASFTTFMITPIELSVNLYAMTWYANIGRLRKIYLRVQIPHHKHGPFPISLARINTRFVFSRIFILFYCHFDTFSY